MTLTRKINTFLEAELGGRDFVVFSGRPGDAVQRLGDLSALGARRRWILAVQPEPEGRVVPDCDSYLSLGRGPAVGDFIAEMRHMEHLAQDPGPAALAWLDGLDPERRALGVIAEVAVVDHVGGRRRLGRRTAASVAWEDKTRIDTLWARLAVPHLPWRVVALDDRVGLDEAEQALDQGQGTVWAGDNHTGLEGGALAVRHVHDAKTRAAALDLLRGRCQFVRVAPFVHGTPCAVHAFVLPSGIAVFCPIELRVVHERDAGTFSFQGCRSPLALPSASCEAMRAVARAAARALAGSIDYRGGLSVDGLLDPAGRFWPTELNPRFSGGLSLLAKSVPELHLRWLDALVRDGLPSTVSAQELEAEVVAAMMVRPQDDCEPEASPT